MSIDPVAFSHSYLKYRSPQVLYDLGRGLEGVYKGVMEFLEEKRANFPRFYFLSNNEMVDVLVRYSSKAANRHSPGFISGMKY